MQYFPQVILKFIVESPKFFFFLLLYFIKIPSNFFTVFPGISSKFLINYIAKSPKCLLNYIIFSLKFSSNFLQFLQKYMKFLPKRVVNLLKKLFLVSPKLFGGGEWDFVKICQGRYGKQPLKVSTPQLHRSINCGTFLPSKFSFSPISQILLRLEKNFRDKKCSS